MKTAIVLAALILAGCSTTPPEGVEMSAEEVQTCKEQGCTVWSQAELMQLMRVVFQKGYEAGKHSL